jgi:hypothetical protein
MRRLAFGVACDAAQADMITAIASEGLQPAEQINPCYFRPVYSSAARCCSNLRRGFGLDEAGRAAAGGGSAGAARLSVGAAKRRYARAAMQILHARG